MNHHSHMYKAVKLASKNDDGSGHQNFPLDGASCISQRNLLQSGKRWRYNEGMFYS